MRTFDFRTDNVSQPTSIPRAAAAGQPIQLPKNQYENSIVKSVTDGEQRPVLSQYLKMGSLETEVLRPAHPLPGSSPPSSFTGAVLHTQANRSESVRSAQRQLPALPVARSLTGFQRQHSRSVDDLLSEPRAIRKPFTYTNNSYETSDTTPPPSHIAGFTYTFGGKEQTVPKRTHEEQVDNRYVRESQAPGARVLVEMTEGAYGGEYAVPYSQIRANLVTPRLRRSVSNPALLASALENQTQNRPQVQRSSAEEERVLRTPRLELSRQQSPHPLQTNNSNSNVPGSSVAMRSVNTKVTSPPVESIQSSQKTKIFKKPAARNSGASSRGSQEEKRLHETIC